MNIKMILIWPLSFIIMLFSLAFPPKTEGDGIAAIYAGHGGSGAICEYKIDLSRKNLWRYYHSPMKGRDDSKLFEGFTFAERLCSKKIAAFLESAEEYGFADWEGSYAPEEPNGPGFGSWHVTVIFANGSERKSYGYDSSAHGPEGYTEMAAAFKALTGMDILVNV